MKHSLFISLLVLIMTTTGTAAQAQPNKQMPNNHPFPTHEQIVSRHCYKMVYDLALDDTKATKFTEIYKAYHSELYSLKQKYHPAKQYHEKYTPKTDEEIEKKFMDKLAENRELIDLREKYYKKFRTILSPRQIERVFKSELSSKDKMKKEQIRRISKKPHKKFFKK